MSVPMSMIPIRDEPQVVAAIQPLKFWLKYKPKLEGGRDTGELRSEEWVEWAKKGVSIPATVSDSIARLKRGAEKATEPDDEKAALWRAIKPFYDNWKAGGTEEVINGTPLAIWPGVTRDVVEALKPFKIYSVEDLSIAPDSVLQRVPDPNIVRYRDRAKKFLQTKDIAAAVRDLDQRDAELAQLKEQLAALQKAHADSERKREETQAALDDVTPPAARKRAPKAA